MLNIAIDGPAGSGKSTVAKIVANKLNILHLDTGAMYRSVALKVLSLGIDPSDEDAVSKIIGDIDLKIEYDSGVQKNILDGKDVSSLIRTKEISMASSTVSAHKCVRLKMVEMQREVAKTLDCILDGRDIGSYVLPDAKYKFFLTADVKVRALRGYNEHMSKGEKVDYDVIEKEVIARDYQDSHREFAPLKQADDAIVVDTSDMTIDEVSSYILSKIEKQEEVPCFFTTSQK